MSNTNNTIIEPITKIQNKIPFSQNNTKNSNVKIFIDSNPEYQIDFTDIEAQNTSDFLDNLEKPNYNVKLLRINSINSSSNLIDSPNTNNTDKEQTQTNSFCKKYCWFFLILVAVIFIIFLSVFIE